MAMRDRAGYQSKKRNAHSRERQPTILIVAEGKNKTETQYFRDFARAYGKRVSFVSDNYTDPENMVNALLKEYKKMGLSPDEGDVGYCLIDSDFVTSKNAQIASADRIALKHDVRVLVSSPCFEIWFLCHHSASTRQYHSSDEIMEELRRQYDGYTKSTKGMFELTQSRLLDAIKNAQILRETCEQNGYIHHTVEFMPSTEIDELAKKLIG